MVAERVKGVLGQVKYLSKGSGDMVEFAIDTTMVECLGDMMITKLDVSRDKGRHGWWNSNVCTVDQLRDELEYALRRGDMISVANFAGMIYMRESMEELANED